MRIFTSESVTEGHPDKICDSIADHILDAVIAQDPKSRVACEVIACTGLVQIMGEITTKATVDYADIARKTILEIGYDDSSMGFDGNTCCVNNCLHQQSPDIAMGVDADGAGDQGMVFGYASNEVVENNEFMPAPIAYAHRLSRKLTEVRKNGVLPYLRPDGKTQVSVVYDDFGNPVKISAVVVSSQHSEEVTTEQLRKDIEKYVIRDVLPANMMDNDTKIFINPTGRFVIGGPYGDSGLTGRKIIVDTYGGMGRHGGGAFSGKDPTKVDRSGAYMARYIAKNVVAAGLADKCEIQIAYAIGVAQPVSVCVESFGTEHVSKSLIEELITKNFDMTPKGIINTLKLRNPIYSKTTNYGHFGKPNSDLPWEQIDKAEILAQYI